MFPFIFPAFELELAAEYELLDSCDVCNFHRAVDEYFCRMGFDAM